MYAAWIKLLAVVTLGQEPGQGISAFGLRLSFSCPGLLFNFWTRAEFEVQINEVAAKNVENFILNVFFVCGCAISL